MSKPISKTDANVITAFDLTVLLTKRPNSTNGKRRYDLWVKHHGICNCCGIETSFTNLNSDKLATIEHIVCQKNFNKHSKERNAASNLTMTCQGCNSTRSDFDYEDFKEAVSVYGRPTKENKLAIRAHCRLKKEKAKAENPETVMFRALNSIDAAVVHAIYNPETRRNRNFAGKFDWIKKLMA